MLLRSYFYIHEEHFFRVELVNDVRRVGGGVEGVVQHVVLVSALITVPLLQDVGVVHQRVAGDAQSAAHKLKL